MMNEWSFIDRRWAKIDEKTISNFWRPFQIFPNIFTAYIDSLNEDNKK